MHSMKSSQSWSEILIQWSASRVKQFIGRKQKGYAGFEQHTFRYNVKHLQCNVDIYI